MDELSFSEGMRLLVMMARKSVAGEFPEAFSQVSEEGKEFWANLATFTDEVIDGVERSLLQLKRYLEKQNG
jgi:hypothetical protein